jgi:hypothetical protein
MKMAHHSNNNLLSERRGNGGFRNIRPVFLVVLTTIILGLAVFIKPSASLILLQSFPNSSLWRDRYLGSDRQHQQQQHHHQQQKQQQQQLEDYYDILGVRRNANKDDIKTAFRQLVKQYHPGMCLWFGCKPIIVHPATRFCFVGRSLFLSSAPFHTLVLFRSFYPSIFLLLSSRSINTHATSTNCCIASCYTMQQQLQMPIRTQIPRINSNELIWRTKHYWIHSDEGGTTHKCTNTNIPATYLISSLSAWKTILIPSHRNGGLPLILLVVVPILPCGTNRTNGNPMRTAGDPC